MSSVSYWTEIGSLENSSSACNHISRKDGDILGLGHTFGLCTYIYRLLSDSGVTLSLNSCFLPKFMSPNVVRQEINLLQMAFYRMVSPAPSMVLTMLFKEHNQTSYSSVTVWNRPGAPLSMAKEQAGHPAPTWTCHPTKSVSSLCSLRGERLRRFGLQLPGTTVYLLHLHLHFMTFGRHPYPEGRTEMLWSLYQ